MNGKEQKQTVAISGASGPKGRKSAGTERPKVGDDLIIVGIGASAGGLDALQRVLPGLPSEAGMAYVIVQHLAPKHRSLLPSLLSKHTVMPVETINDGMLVRPDTLYITPPNKDVTLSGNRLKLRPAASIGPRPSIDYFFNSLAEEKKAHAVGIILSGTGTDGAHGIRAIKSNDGITMAQTVETAKFDGMPQAAMNTGLVDLILPPEEIGQELETALKYPNLIARAPLDLRASEIEDILDMLQQRTGVDFSDYKQTTIHRRISRRMVIHKIHDLQGYISHIKKHPAELTILQKDLLISVTRFFRDSKAFEALARRLGEVFERKQAGDTFRAWVPGCSTGEEAYSIAILVAEILGNDLTKYRIQIFATDLDDDSIQLARKGEYPVATILDTDGRRFEKHFSHRDNTVTVKKHIRDMVVLARQDLIKDTPFLHLDLISCRNLMIYFNSELQDKLLSLFQFSLNAEGLLFLGKSESINQRMDLFKAVDNRWKIYRRREGPAKRLPKLMQNHHMAQLASHRAHLKKHQDKGGKIERAFVDSLLGLLDCCAVLTDEHANILYIRGDVSAYFKFPEGSVRDNLNAVEVARPEIRFVLQSMLHKFAKDGRTVTSSAVPLGENGKGVQIKVGFPLKKASESDRMIVFTPMEVPKSTPRRTSSVSEEDHERIRELEQELDVTREHLQDTIEELETSSEELQSLNEELQSANEELQASNEELETSNEELQASNEELNTVNDELRAKSEEAAELLEDFKKSERRYRLLVDNMNEALMLCEIEYGRENRPTDLIIKQANPSFEKLASIRSNELPLRANLAHLHELATEDMLQRFVDVAGGGSPQRIETRLSALGKDLTLSVYSLEEGHVGIVCRDDSERKESEAALLASEQRAQDQLAELEAIYESAPVGLCIFDDQLRFLRINRRLAEINGIAPEAHIGRALRDVVPDLADQAEALQRRILQSGDAVYDVEFFGETPSQPGVERTWTEQWFPIKDDAGRVRAINVVALEITERKLAEEALRASELRYRTLGETIPYGVWQTDASGACTYVSNSFLEMTGMTLPEIQEFGWLHLLPEEDREPTQKHWLDCVRTGKDFEREHQFRAADGTPRHVLAIGRPVRNDRGEIASWVGINLDITERKRVEKKLVESQKNLRVSLDEKEVLLKEIHHRVKNNMQIISSLMALQADQIQDDSLRNVLADLTTRVRSMAMIHEKLYESSDLARVEFADYTSSLLKYLWNAHKAPESGIRLDLDLEPVSLPVNTAVPCGLILNELVGNALKHAFGDQDKGRVKVSLHRDTQGKACLSVRDNGKGLRPEFDWQQTRSLGLHLVQMLVRQIRAAVDVSSDDGTKFVIEFETSDHEQ